MPNVIPWDSIIASVVTVVVAVIGSSWFSTWMQNKSKYSNRALMKRMDDMEYKNEQEKANAARRRILDFDGELRRNVPHTEEQWNNILEDVDFYLNYCRNHPEYQNTKATAAIKHIKGMYQERLKNNDFLK